jgi:hypothetical protein
MLGPGEIAVIVGVILLVIVAGSGFGDGLTGKGKKKDG